MNWRLGITLLLVASGALALRLARLDARPFHNDEGVNAYKIQALWDKGQYAYDPNEHHGPSLYYATLPFLWMCGPRDPLRWTDATLRFAPVAFGVGLIFLLWLLRRPLGPTATAGAAVLTALSPAMVFYTRYFIHEILLVFFTFLLIAAACRYSETRKFGWAMLAGAALGLIYATKETFVIALAALLLAALLEFVWQKYAAGTLASEPPASTPPLSTTLRHHAKPALAALALAAAVSVVLFTSFFTNWHGPIDSIRSYLPWLDRASGNSPHAHPWWFYLQRLAWFHAPRGPIWTEASILILAVIGFGAALARRLPPPIQPSLIRFLGFYTILLTGFYAAISYKTPWCMLGFLHGFILLAGAGQAVLVHISRHRFVQSLVALVLATAVAHLGWQAWRASVPFASNPTNPYVYAQTVPDVLGLVQRTLDLAKVHPDGNQMLVKVIAPESIWPLPWYLRSLTRVGWWDQDQLPNDPYAPVIIVSTQLAAALDDKSNKKWLMVGLSELRPRVFLEMYVEFNLWKKYIESRTPQKETQNPQ